MSNKIATPKQTGGGGFTFEDQVCASFLLKMLSGVHPLSASDGQIESVRFQKRVDGWLLDDLVLLLRNDEGDQHSLAMSVKSSNYITGTGFPLEFVTAIWEQALHSATAKFEIPRDYLGIATRQLAPEIKNSWDSLLSKAINADPEDFGRRLQTPRYSNSAERSLFSSLRCPSNISHSTSECDTATLLKRVRHFQFDFESEPSHDESVCVSRCHELLRSGNSTIAASLWIHLKQIARALATAGGDCSRRQLSDELHPFFTLNEFVNYASDWKKVRRDFALRVERFKDQLGGILRLEINNTNGLVKSGCVTVLAGSSGSGKSVLAKQIACAPDIGNHAIWLTASDLNSGTVSGLLRDLSLTYRIPELLSESLVDHGIIVVDSVERLTDTGYANLGSLLRSARINSDSTPWAVILTCVLEFWENCLHEIRKEFVPNAKFEFVEIQFPFKQHRSNVIAAFPALTRMLQRNHLQGVFQNLKILDLVLSKVSDVNESAKWIGETDILDWYWQQISRGQHGTARSRFVQKLACLEADKFTSSVSIHEFTSSECELSTALRQEEVVWERGEQFGFEHDLFGDWARVRYLISVEDSFAVVCNQKSVNPRWHRAIRLFGLRKLEARSGGINSWRTLLLGLSAADKDSLEKDLVLESVIFAANAEELLQEAWPTLSEHDGRLLKRLLSRFLYVATIHPMNTGLPDNTATAIHHRYPIWQFWMLILRVLYTKRESAICLATDLVTKAAELWINSSSSDWPLREEACEILLESAEFVINRIRNERKYYDYELSENIFSRLLSASAVRPDMVAEIALSLVERREVSRFSQDDSDFDSDYDLHEDEMETEPWPEGPYRKVRDEVRSGFLSISNSLQHLFAVRPEVASEILLALLICEPIPPDRHGFNISGLEEFLHLETNQDWSPPIFFHGPFFAFLRINSEKAIDVIIRLSNFATARWIDNRAPSPKPIEITLGDKKCCYFGGKEVYFWYRDPMRAPEVVVPALMALERWLYLCLENDLSVKSFIVQILSTSNSTSTLGVLAAMGRKKSTLFKDELRAFVPIWQLYQWEENYKIENLESILGGMTMMQWVRWGEDIFNLVKDWHTLSHRKTSIGDEILKLHLSDETIRPCIREALSVWNYELAHPTESTKVIFLERITSQFDLGNWQMRKADTNTVLQYVEPAERLAKVAEARRSHELYVEMQAFPVECRKVIDENKPLGAIELGVFWRRLQLIGDDFEAALERGDEPEHAILGGLAVLLIFHREWVELNPERKRACEQLSEKITSNLDVHSAFAGAFATHHAANFMALMLPALLLEDTLNKRVRFTFAHFAVAYNHLVLEDLMNSSFENRSRMKEDFRRLQRLVLTFSGLKSVKLVTHDGNSLWGCPDIDFDFEARREILIHSFAECSLSADVPLLTQIAVGANNMIFDMVKQQEEMKASRRWTNVDEASVKDRINRLKGFDLHQIKAAFTWLERIDTESDCEARSEWLATLEDILHAVLRPLGGLQEATFDDENSTFFNVPHHEDAWIFEVIAKVIPKLKANESARKLWEPIFSLGLNRKHWVDSFLTSWFHHGLKVEGGETRFQQEWKEMINFAWIQDNWRVSQVRSRFPDNELLHHLMGFSRFGGAYFEEEKNRHLIVAMKSDFERWADEFLLHPEAICHYASLLSYASAIDYLHNGVRRLANATTEFEEWFWQESYNLAPYLLRLLEYVWKIKHLDLKASSQFREDFTIILKSLSDRQFPQAMELQDRMVRSN